VNHKCFTRYVNQAIISHWIKSDIFSGCVFPRQGRNKRWVRWETEWPFDGKFCQKYSYQKLSKSDIIGFHENVGDAF